MTEDRKNIDRQFSLQKSDADTKLYLPILLELLENLNVLEYALIFHGMHCPPIEHRVPTFSPKDEEGKVSFAKRSYDFFRVGRFIIRDCRKIMFIVPNGKLPKILDTCREIKNHLLFKEEGKKSNLEQIQLSLMNVVAENTLGTSNYPKEIELDKQKLDALREKITSFYERLEDAIEEELPAMVLK